LIEVPLLLLLAATALQRSAELRLSRRNLRRMAEWAEQRGARLHASESARAFAVMVALQVLLLLAPAVENLLAGRVTPTPLWVAAAVLWAAGQLLRLSSQRALGDFWNARGVVAEGQPVLSGGPYSLVRHPNYLGVLLEAVALPLAGSAWFTLALLTPLVWATVLRRLRAEEAAMRVHTDYAAAFDRLPSLIPRHPADDEIL